MKPEEFPTLEKLASDLKKVTGVPIEPSRLNVKDSLKKNNELSLSDEVECQIKYESGEEDVETIEMQGIVRVVVKTKEGARQAVKRFESGLTPGDVPDITIYTHISPFDAFRAAIQWILDGKGTEPKKKKK